MRTKGKFKVMAAGLAAVGMLASCSVNDEINERERDTPVRFTAGIEKAGEVAVPQSRAAETDWAVDDKVGIFMVQSGTTNIAEGAENMQYQVSADGAAATFEAVAGDEIFYPQDGAVDFIAYYPYVGTATLAGTIDVTIGDQTQQPTFDLLYSKNATGKAKSENAVELKFGHKLSKLVMNVTAGDGLSDSDLSGMTVTVKGMNTKNTFDLSTGSLGTPNTPAEITPRTIATGQGFAASYDAIILPSAATANEGDYSVDFTINPNTPSAETFTWKMKAGTDFDGGNEYTYKVTVARTGVTATGEITPWTSNDRGQVTAE